MKKLVWVSPHLPYDTVGHAGGKIQNYYMNQLIKQDAYDIRLISFYKPQEMQKFTMDKAIKCDLFCYYDKGVKKLIRNFIDLNYLKNPYHRFANRTTKFLEINIIQTLKKYKKNGFEPELIVLQWTQTILFVNKVKQIFPNAKIIAIEEDVTLLSCKRMIDIAKSDKERKYAKIRFSNMEREELSALRLCDLIILNNFKDKKILEEYGLTQGVEVWTPYFDNMLEVKRDKTPKSDVLFYGAMARPENYLSVQWLLDNVRPLLKDRGVRYVIVGGNPHESIKKYEGEDVVVTGFVDDVVPYFKEALCLAAPLVLGAGIKIKVLEALSSGIPVLTNEIGIEGIPAQNGRDFLFCQTPEEYADAINKLMDNVSQQSFFEENSKKFIRDNFNYEKSSVNFSEWLGKLTQ